MPVTRLFIAAAAAVLVAADVHAATVVPNEIQQPGTQPRQVGNLESPDKCDNCHGGYNTAVEPAFNWRGSMMAQAGRDAIFWATLAIVEQDFAGAGDLCLRCHAPEGWIAGRSTPTDGSGLAAGDATGVACDLCHKMTNPDRSEHLGLQTAPFIANDEQTPAAGYYGSGMYVLWSGADKLGPYSDAAARHQFLQSRFHRSRDFCGSCHDVSNPAVGDLAPNNGAQLGQELLAGTFSGALGSPVETKAAFNNFPYQYGIVERTYSEFRAGLLSRTLVSDYAGLPADLKAGAVQAAFDAAGGNYKDGTPRYFTCQTCHMRAITGAGCNKAGVPIRQDLPLHDMTGGNYWMPDAILYQNSVGTLRLGQGMTTTEIAAVQAGQSRAMQQLKLAASVSVSGNIVKVTNLTGHKLISGYPEGRRMWLNVKWYDATGALLREDGKYGAFTTLVGGVPTTVETILDLADPSTKIYEAHYAITQEWAALLIGLGYDPLTPVEYDRAAGHVAYTLGEVAGQGSGTFHETFHFALNNTVAKDNRIPPYGMSYDEARMRNALPVPTSQYGAPMAGGTYDYWDSLALNPPGGASYATIDLMYQPTSWEYVQFLLLANKGTNPFLAQEGKNLYDAWVATGMAKPYVMASAAWGTPPAAQCATPGTPGSLTATAGRRSVTLAWRAASPMPQTAYRVYYDQAGKLQFRASASPTTLTYKDSNLSHGVQFCYRVTSFSDCNGNGVVDAGEESAPSNLACASAQ
jgi:hypothetical protein